MSIVAVQSVTVFGLLRDKERILEEFQAMGCLHLRSLNPEQELQPAGESLSEETREAWRFLKDCPWKRIQVRRSGGYDAAQMQTRALEILRRLEECTDEHDFLRQRIKNIRPWGDFQFAPLEEMEGLSLWFYVVPRFQLAGIEDMDLVWEIVRRDNRFGYVVVVSDEEPEGMPVERVLVGAKSLTQLEDRLEEVDLEIDELQREREGLTRGLTIYEKNMHRLEDMAARSKAGRLTCDREPVFAIQAWAPREKTDALREYAAAGKLAIRIEDPSSEDKPPTLLENPERWAVGEDLVGFYMMPGYRLWDPSMVVLFSFALFFAMILSDAGYGLIMAAGLFFLRHKLKKSPAGLRQRTLFGLLAGSTIVWGVLVGSYFGIGPPEGTLLARLKLLDVNDMNFMMKLSILVGAAHIILANAMDSWRQRSSPAALAPLGWIAVIISALVLGMGNAAEGGGGMARSLGSIGLVLGFVVVFFFSGAGAATGFGKRVFGGLMGLTRVTSIFGDILSYLRLFALGLASASLAMAFNGLAKEVHESFHGLGILLAIVIIVIGHTINFVLCIVSGFVHGLRLNLIEFFNWSIAEEGRPFRAFRKKEIV